MKTTTDLTNESVRIRPLTEADVPFIFSSWLKSYRESQFGRGMARTFFFTEHHKVIERLLKTCEVFIACNDQDVADIFGYICGERTGGVLVIHYIYVKHTYRNLGIGKLLLNCFSHTGDVAALYTHKTPAADKLAERFNMAYHPYIALTPDYRKKVTLNMTTGVKKNGVE